MDRTEMQRMMESMTVEELDQLINEVKDQLSIRRIETTVLEEAEASDPFKKAWSVKFSKRDSSVYALSEMNYTQDQISEMVGLSARHIRRVLAKVRALVQTIEAAVSMADAFNKRGIIPTYRDIDGESHLLIPTKGKDRDRAILALNDLNYDPKWIAEVMQLSLLQTVKIITADRG